MIRALIFDKPKHAGIEFVRFLPVAGMTTVIDFGVLILLTEHYHVHYLTSAVVGFAAGQVWSYYMCVNWIFAKFSAKDHISGLAVFLLIAAVGLALTVVLLWLFTEQAGIYYLYSKVFTSAISFLALFFLRKRFLFS